MLIILLTSKTSRNGELVRVAAANALACVLGKSLVVGCPPSDSGSTIVYEYVHRPVGCKKRYVARCFRTSETKAITILG